MRLAWCLTVITALFLPVSATAQGVGASVGLAHSDYRELSSPLSLGLRITLPVIGWIHARADYRRYSDEQEWRRSTCRGLVAPGTPCPDDLFEGNFTLQVTGAGITVVAPLLEAVSVAGGVQRSWTWADGVWQGRESDVMLGHAPNQREAGWSYLAWVSHDLTRQVSVSAEARIDRPEIRSCIADGYSGFCEHHSIRSLEVGLAFSPGVAR